MKLCKKQIFGEQTVAARSDVIAKKLLADCFKTVADGPKTGLLAARAISSVQGLFRQLFFANRHIHTGLEKCGNRK